MKLKFFHSKENLKQGWLVNRSAKKNGTEHNHSRNSYNNLLTASSWALTQRLSAKRFDPNSTPRDTGIADIFTLEELIHSALVSIGSLSINTASEHALPREEKEQQ